jgi:hypothetical protein
MGTIKSAELKQYIYRKLGHPVINVEVDETQLEDVIDEALKTFVESHYDACDIGYIEVQVQAGVKDYYLPEAIQDVMECLNHEGESSSTFFFGDEPLLLNREQVLNEPCGYYDVVSVEVYRQRLALIEDTYRRHILFEFNQLTKKLTFPEAPEANGTRVLKVAQAADTTGGNNAQGMVVDSLWLKKYAVALARIQWGVNLGKYSGAQLPGGVEINAGEIREKGETDKENLLTELEEKYTFPPDPVFA